MLRVVASTLVSAPKATVSDVYSDHPNWPRLFPTINGVRLLRREGAKLVLEIDHVEGEVVNELLVRSADEISLWEVHRRFDALFVNRFETIPRGDTLHRERRVPPQGLRQAAQAISPRLRALQNRAVAAAAGQGRSGSTRSPRRRAERTC